MTSAERAHINLWSVIRLMVLVACALPPAGCRRESTSTPPDTESSEAASPTADRDLSSDLFEDEPSDLPEDRESLLAYMNRMSAPPAESDPESQATQLRDMMRARAAAARRFLQMIGNDASDAADRKLVSRMYLESLHILASLGDRPSIKATRDFAKTLTKSDDEELALWGRLGQFLSMVDDFLYDENPNPPAPFMDTLPSLYVEPRVLEVFDALCFAAQALSARGQLAQAAEVHVQISRSFGNHDRPDVATQAAEMGRQSKRLFVESACQELMLDQKVDVKDLIKRIIDLLEVAPDDRSNLELAMRAAIAFEELDETDQAKDVWTALLEGCSNTSELLEVASEQELPEERLKTLRDLAGRTNASE